MEMIDVFIYKIEGGMRIKIGLSHANLGIIKWESDSQKV